MCLSVKRKKVALQCSHVSLRLLSTGKKRHFTVFIERKCRPGPYPWPTLLSPRKNALFAAKIVPIALNTVWPVKIPIFSSENAILGHCDGVQQYRSWAHSKRACLCIGSNPGFFFSFSNVRKGSTDNICCTWRVKTAKLSFFLICLANEKCFLPLPMLFLLSCSGSFRCFLPWLRFPYEFELLRTRGTAPWDIEIDFAMKRIHSPPA